MTKQKQNTVKPKTQKPQKEKWFKVGLPTGWRKTDLPNVRRRKVLQSRKGDLLASAKALNALANVSRDKKTKYLARQDANYFFDRHRKEKK